VASPLFARRRCSILGDVPEAAPSDEQTREQRYLDGAYRQLEAMTRRASLAAADAAERAAGDWDATVALSHLTKRVKSLAADARPLCFGRIDETATAPAASWYIGRRHVEDGAGDPVVVDWRAPVAVPFYRATFRDPCGLRLRRRFILEQARTIVDLLDEDFDDPDTAGHTAASGLPDPLLAELGRSRTGTMHDIVATIAAEQDRIIRAPLDTPLVVQGGPGTGKTAVGLHRAAFLLYEHRAQLERQGVLVLGPNPLFLAYISDVLPSLGEVAVVQTTLAGLAGAWRRGGEDAADVARLKGDLRMATVIDRACRLALRPPDEPLETSTRWGSVRLLVPELTEMLDAALASPGSLNQRRLRFRSAIVRSVTATLVERRPDAVVDLDDIGADLRRDRALQRALDRIWPNQTAASVVRALLRRPETRARASDTILSPEEQDLLGRAGRGDRRVQTRNGRPVGQDHQGRADRRAQSPAGRPEWAESDLPLLDEAHAVLTGPPRRYGYVVVDEAQDLSGMALRMVARRSADGRSLTILGDLAQATAPGSTRDWADAIAALGHPPGACVEALATGYRVPGQIMDVANRLLADGGAGLPLTTSVRVTDDPPLFRAAGPGQLVAAAVDEAVAVLARFASVAMIALPALQDDLADQLRRHEVPLTPRGQPPAAGTVTLLEPAEAKGLEFDAVIVVDPGAWLDQPAGRGLLYIALTRAVQHLSVVHTDPLPPALATGRFD
jgi:hypothetical protein